MLKDSIQPLKDFAALHAPVKERKNRLYIKIST
jgi:hypothetical protein